MSGERPDGSMQSLTAFGSEVGLRGEFAQCRNLLLEFGMSDRFQVREHVGGVVLRAEYAGFSSEQDVMLIDFDDTIAKCTDAKEDRRVAFSKFLPERGLDLSAEHTRLLLDGITNSFSRRPIHGRRMYDIDDHIIAVAWGLQQLEEAPMEDRDAILFSLETALERVRTTGVTKFEDPVEFDDGQIKPKPGSSLSALAYALDQDVFVKSRDVPPYEDFVDDLYKLAQLGRADGDPLRLAVLTYGKPSSQLRKVLAFLAEQERSNRPIIFSDILLTAQTKGEFLSDPSLRGEFCGADHGAVLVDDNPEELGNVREHFPMVDDPSSGKIGLVRVERDGIKTAGRIWDLDQQVGFDAHTQSIHADEEGTGIGARACIALAHSVLDVARAEYVGAERVDNRRYEQLAKRYNRYVDFVNQRVEKGLTDGKPQGSYRYSTVTALSLSDWAVRSV